MRPASIAGLLAAVTLALTIPTSAARASACDEEIVANIAMAPGRVCWVYRGNATVFVGDFGGGQRIEARMIGEAADYNPSSGRVVTHTANRVPDASGPGNFYTEGGDGHLGFYTPRGGIYRFSFSPCAMWGATGVVEICAR